MKKTHAPIRYTLRVLFVFFLTLTLASCGDDESPAPSTPVVGQAPPEAVDLGLPSGTKWASYNIYGLGDYVPWGDLAPHTASGCTWESYRFGMPDMLTKYCYKDTHGKDGYTDESVLGRKLTELDPEDDIARQQWGEGWRIPSKEQWEELIKYCSIKKASADMRHQLSAYIPYRFTGPNGNYIDLPCEGYGYRSALSEDNCVYWSRTLHESLDRFAYNFRYNKKALIQFNDRAYGMSIRPVKEADANDEL